MIIKFSLYESPHLPSKFSFVMKVWILLNIASNGCFSYNETKLLSHFANENSTRACIMYIAFHEEENHEKKTTNFIGLIYSNIKTIRRKLFGFPGRIETKESASFFNTKIMINTH